MSIFNGMRKIILPVNSLQGYAYTSKLHLLVTSFYDGCCRHVPIGIHICPSKKKCLFFIIFATLLTYIIFFVLNNSDLDISTKRKVCIKLSGKVQK